MAIWPVLSTTLVTVVFPPPLGRVLSLRLIHRLPSWHSVAFLNNPRGILWKEKKYGTLEEMKDKWSMKYGVRENAERIFPLLLQRFHAHLSFLH